MTRLLVCRCRQCRLVRRKSKAAHYILRCQRKAARHQDRQLLRMGRYDDVSPAVPVSGNYSA